MSTTVTDRRAASGLGGRAESPEPAPPSGSQSESDQIDVAETAARLRLAALRLSRKIRQQVPQEVTQSQVSVLSSVEGRGNPTLGELAVAEGVRPPSMTRQVDALVSAGLLHRTSDATDRRVARVQLTAAGRKALQRSRSLRTAYMARRIAKLSEEDQRRAGELVSLLELLAGTEVKRSVPRKPG
jgi:DNA-binding MarR family transcriptional regulator